KKEAEKLLSRFDLGFSAFEIEKKLQSEGGVSLRVQMLHSFGEKTAYLPLQYESSGTQRLFAILKHVLRALSTGSPAVLDELDVNLHPEMLVAIFEMFVHPETNPKNAQLLFSTHS